MNLFKVLALACILISCGDGENSSKESEKQQLLNMGEKIKKNGKAANAIEYNDGIIGLQGQIVTEMVTVMSLEGKDPVADLQKLIITIKDSKGALERLEVYEGGDEMKTTALDLFDFYLRACEGPWMKAYTMFKESEGSLNPDQEEEFTELLEQGGEGESQYDKAFEDAQAKFAQFHKFEIGGNALQDDINNINK
ncbi:MAG: hypothetical protein WED33_08835 [Bacteroidia bacterium]